MTQTIFPRKTIVENPIIEKFESYRQFQKKNSQIIFLVHFLSIFFYIDIDAFNRRGFGTTIYHLKFTCSNPKKTETFRYRTLFFSRMFNDAEIKYWPIEFEMANLI